MLGHFSLLTSIFGIAAWSHYLAHAHRRLEVWDLLLFVPLIWLAIYGAARMQQRTDMEENG